MTDTTAVGRSGWDTARLLAAHVLLLSGLQSDNLDEFHPARNALEDLATCLDDAGSYALVLSLSQVCLHAEEQVLGPDHPDTLTSRSNLAETLRAAQTRRGRWWPWRRTEREDTN
ncbi:MAG: hypothetical protein ACT4NY_10465 [Pseudonocardiales bacterium]